MAAPQVNGEVPHSAFFDHLLRYPVVSDGVSTVKQNKYGQQGLALSTSAYQTFAKPVIPYLVKPYGYVSPYVKRADDIGDKTLSQIDERFPVVTKPTAEVYEETKSIVLFPYRKSVESRDHIFSVYTDERKQIGGDGYVPLGKALFSTALVVTTETLTWFRALINSTKQQVQEKANQWRNAAPGTAGVPDVDDAYGFSGYGYRREYIGMIDECRYSAFDGRAYEDDEDDSSSLRDVISSDDDDDDEYCAPSCYR